MGCGLSTHDKEEPPTPLQYPEEFYPFEVQMIKDECMRASAFMAGKGRKLDGHKFETQPEMRERKLRQHIERREARRWENGMDVIPENERWRQKMPTIPERARYNGKSKLSPDYTKRQTSYREDRYPRMGQL